MSVLADLILSENLLLVFIIGNIKQLYLLSLLILLEILRKSVKMGLKVQFSFMQSTVRFSQWKIRSRMLHRSICAIVVEIY